MVGIPTIAATLGTAALTNNPIGQAFLGASVGNAAWRLLQDRGATRDAIVALAAGGQIAVQGAQVAADAVLGAGGLGLDAIDRADGWSRRPRGKGSGRGSGGGRGAGASGSGYRDPAGAVQGKSPQPGLPDGSGPGAPVTSGQLDALRRQQEEALAAERERSRRAMQGLRDQIDGVAKGSGTLPPGQPAFPTTGRPLGSPEDRTADEATRRLLGSSSGLAAAPSHAAHLAAPVRRRRTALQMQQDDDAALAARAGPQNAPISGPRASVPPRLLRRGRDPH